MSFKAVSKQEDPMAASPMVDLRSDTVTLPTPEMYERMANAPLGDDGLDFDPSARELEEYMAQVLGKEAGLFVPSCTMANLLATLTQSQSRQQIILDSSAHMYTSERGGATFTGLFYVGIPGQGGVIDLAETEDALKGNKSKLSTALVTMETSHNNSGGLVPPVAHMRNLYELAHQYGAQVHLDGARLFNAAVSLGVPAATLASCADTVAVCLSKGLSAPVGAVLTGSSAIIHSARQMRRMIGGTQRQVGIMAAAGKYAVEHMVDRLADDHKRAAMLSDQVNALDLPIAASQAQTNIVQVDVSHYGVDSSEWVKALKNLGLLTRPWGANKLRCVTHRHIKDSDIAHAVNCVKRVTSTFSH